MLDNIPTASPTTARASRWTSYRTPRYPSKWLPVDRQQNTDTKPGAISANSPEPTYNIGYATSGRSSYQTPMYSANLSLAIEPQGDSDIEIGATSENLSGPLDSADHDPGHRFLLPTSSTKLATTVQENKPEQPKCTACWIDLDQSTIPIPCGHYWCSSCIVRRFTKIRNQVEWPVRCHSGCTIPLDTAKSFLQDGDIRTLTPLIEEFETAVMDRVYCSNTKCSILVARRDNESRLAHCEACQTNTCPDCKGAAHKSDDCPLPNEDEQKTLITSHKEGWQRCTRCGQMCERVSGCSSIICPCAYNFCYHCAGPIYACNGCPEIEYGPRDRTRADRKQRKKAERTSRRQNDFRKEFAAFTTRRARARTNDGRVAIKPETSYQQRQRLEDDNFAVMMEQIHRRLDAERAQMERDRAERARRKQPSSIARRVGRKIQRLCGRVFGL